MPIFRKLHSILNLTNSLQSQLARTVEVIESIPLKLEAIYAAIYAVNRSREHQHEHWRTAQHRRQSQQMDLTNKLLVHIVGQLYSLDLEQIDDDVVDEVNASCYKLLMMNNFADSPEQAKQYITKFEADRREAERKAKYEATRQAAKERLAHFSSSTDGDK